MFFSYPIPDLGAQLAHGYLSVTTSRPFQWTEMAKIFRFLFFFFFPPSLPPFLPSIHPSVLSQYHRVFPMLFPFPSLYLLSLKVRTLDPSNINMFIHLLYLTIYIKSSRINYTSVIPTTKLLCKFYNCSTMLFVFRLTFIKSM